MVPRTKFILICTVVLALSCGVWQACFRHAHDHDSEYGGTIRWVLPRTPHNFSPFSRYLWNYTATNLIFEGLVRYSDDDFTIEPALATSWQVSPDGLEWTFQLREGVTFHDGTPFKAHAVKFHFDRILEENHPHAPPDFGQGQRASWFMTTIGEIDVLSEYAIVFRLERAFTCLLDMLCQHQGFIMSPASVIKWGDQVIYHPEGTGPFVLSDYIPKQQCNLKANLDYYAGRPFIDAIEFHPRSNVSINFSLVLLSGAIDGVLFLSPVDAGLRRNSKITIVSHPGFNQNYYVMNLTRPPLNNRLVRQAIRYAFDQESLINRISSENNEPAASILPSPFLPAELRPPNHYPYNPEKARQLLELAGYPDGLTLSISEQFPSLASATLGHVYYLARFLERVGITLNIDCETDRDVYWQKIEEDEFDIFFTQNFALHSNGPLYLKSLLDVQFSESGVTSYVNNDTIHQLLYEQLYGNERTDRNAAIAEIVRLVEEEAYFIPFDNVSNRAVYSNRLKGFKLHPILSRYNFHQVWKEE